MHRNERAVVLGDPDSVSDQAMLQYAEVYRERE